MYANPPEFEFQGTIFKESEIKFRRSLFTFLRKHEILHSHFVVVQNGKEMYKKACKVVVLLIKTIAFFRRSRFRRVVES